MLETLRLLFGISNNKRSPSKGTKQPPRPRATALLKKRKAELKRKRQHKSIWEVLVEDYNTSLFLSLAYFCVLFAILFFPQPLFTSVRWEPMIDMNRDGFFTISDLFYWCFWLFYLPGDVVLSVVFQFRPAAQFFELFSESYGGLGSLIMSSMYWWTLGGIQVLGAWLAPIVIQTFFRS